MHRKILYITVLIFFTTSCAENFDAIKRGITGTKKNSADEFLVKKKDPLILPPDYENLPTPGEEAISLDENLIFENTLEDDDKEDLPVSKSVESSILEKIRSR